MIFAGEMHANNTPIMESNRSAYIMGCGDVGEIAVAGVAVVHTFAA